MLLLQKDQIKHSKEDTCGFEHLNQLGKHRNSLPPPFETILNGIQHNYRFTKTDVDGNLILSNGREICFNLTLYHTLYDMRWTNKKWWLKCADIHFYNLILKPHTFTWASLLDVLFSSFFLYLFLTYVSTVLNHLADNVKRFRFKSLFRFFLVS